MQPLWLFIIHTLFIWQQKSKHDIYIGEDSMKMFWTDLREQKTEIIKGALSVLK